MSTQAIDEQARFAQGLYNDRSDTYDDSWHPRFARHLVQLAGIKAGDSVLDLACGTGLSTFAASDAAGPDGHVTGIDITPGMLKQARKKLEADPRANIEFHQHSIMDLASLQALHGRHFDVITCASALVLLPDPGRALKAWAKYLKSGGRLAVDVTHPRSQLAGIVLERVGEKIGKRVPYHRTSFLTAEDLESRMGDAGLQHISTTAVSQMPIAGQDALERYISDPEHLRIEKVYSVNDADGIFEKAIGYTAATALADPAIRENVRLAFTEEWAKLANEDGKINEVDCVWVSVGIK